jgi:hypothetical protein
MFCHGVMMHSDAGALDEALDRLHRTGPEFEGWLSNHGPMAVEVLASHGAEVTIHPWVDRYVRRLEDVPRGGVPVDEDWRSALGDPSRLGDWILSFHRELLEAGWDDVLVRWWPRLLPGIAAGATHGVIRTGHAVRALREEVTAPRVEELAHALAYWAARWQVVPAVHPVGPLDAGRLVGTVPRVPRQEGGIRERLALLDETAGWHEHVERLAPTGTDGVPSALDSLVDAVVVAYPAIAHGEPTMLVHAATAPNAVARVLPSLPSTLWQDSYAYAWSASAAVLAAYRPAEAVVRTGPTEDPDEAWGIAVGHGGEHVIKLADTALDVFGRTRNPVAIHAIGAAIDLDA